ncbi:hypothetical protein D3C87_1068960 [compost metagenome]
MGIQQQRERYGQECAREVRHQVESELVRRGGKGIVLLHGAVIVVVVLHMLGMRDQMIHGFARHMVELSLHCAKGLQWQNQHHENGYDSRHGTNST